MAELFARPQNVTVDRAAGVMRVTWQDSHVSEYSLRWLRANCPCATCREERRTAAMNTDPLRLVTGPAPSIEIAGADFVGHYGIRLAWTDGHATGIYMFSALRECCPCPACNADGPPPLLPE